MDKDGMTVVLKAVFKVTPEWEAKVPDEAVMKALNCEKDAKEFGNYADPLARMVYQLLHNQAGLPVGVKAVYLGVAKGDHESAEEIFSVNPETGEVIQNE